MKITKKCNSTKQNINNQRNNKRCSSAGMFYTSSAGAVTSLILMKQAVRTVLFGHGVGPARLHGRTAPSFSAAASERSLRALFLRLASITLISVISAGIIITNDTYATTSTLTLSVTDSVSLNIVSTSSTGTFATTDTSTNNISVKTTNGTGYTLGIKASTNNSNALINTADSQVTIPSISSSTFPSGVSEANYKDDTYASTNNLNNTWGYRPSKLNSAANSNYLPAPTSASTITTLDKTTVSNPSTANTYNIALGTRITDTTVQGSYTNTFVITAVVNPTIYSITYNKNTTDTVTNMPSNVTNQETTGETVNIASTVPVRDGYNFKGWCTAQVADGAACTGTSYAPSSSWTIDQTASTNSLSIYAMWESAGPNCNPTGTTISTISCMQDISSTNKSSVLSSMTQGTQYKLVDSRDGQEYWIAKQADGNIWMTQNLDLCIGCTGVASLTSDNTDLNTSGTDPYVTGYSTSGGVITWSPSSKTSDYTMSGDTVSPAMPNNTAANSAPYSVEGGDRYYFTTGTTSNETAQTLAECTAVSGRTAELCAHYHAGNYYNWTAAIASNASSGIGSTRYDNAANSICPKGWKLPSGRASSNTSTTRQFGYLWQQAGITSSLTATSFASGGFNKIRTSPLFFVRGGDVDGSSLYNGGGYAYYWSSTVNSTSYAYGAYFLGSTSIISAYSNDTRYDGLSVRCMVR